MATESYRLSDGTITDSAAEFRDIYGPPAARP